MLLASCFTLLWDIFCSNRYKALCTLVVPSAVSALLDCSRKQHRKLSTFLSHTPQSFNITFGTILQCQSASSKLAVVLDVDNVEFV